MKRFAFTLCIVAVAISLCDPAVAGPCVVRRAAIAHQEVAVVTPAVVATFLPINVAAYSASYTPPTDPAIVKAIADLGTRLDRLEKAGTPSPPGSAPMPKADVADAGALKFAVNCASCHDAAVSKAKGGGVTLFKDGAEADISCDLALLAVGAIADGTMPRGKKLPEEDGPDILSHLAKRAKK
jgi:mono/diheme cytochrome c family protein